MAPLPNKKEIYKYVSAIKASKRKFLTVEMLSNIVGIYSDIIAENISYFEPMVMLDQNINLQEVLPKLEDYIKDEQAPSKRKKKVSEKDNLEYESVQDFIYKKMTIAGGLIDKNTILSPHDLKALKRVINEELKKNKAKHKK